MEHKGIYSSIMTYYDSNRIVIMSTSYLGRWPPIRVLPGNGNIQLRVQPFYGVRTTMN